MKTLKVLMIGVLGLLGACEKRAPNTDSQGKDYVASRDPNPNVQPVAGHDVPASEIYWVSADGERTVISDSTLVTQLQQKLHTANVYDGATDGRVNADLEPSIRKYQSQHGLAQTGVIDIPTAKSLEMTWDKAKAPTVQAPQEVKQVGKEIKDAAKTTGQEVKEGAKDVKEFLDDKTPQAPQEVKQMGEDIKDATKATGQEMKQGAKDVKDFVDKSATDLDKKIDEKTGR